jgi:hypothetical protein
MRRGFRSELVSWGFGFGGDGLTWGTDVVVQNTGEASLGPELGHDVWLEVLCEYEGECEGQWQCQ